MISISELPAPATQSRGLDEGLGYDVFTDTYSNGGIGDGNGLTLDAALYGDGGINALIGYPNLAVGVAGRAVTLRDGLQADNAKIETDTPALLGLFVLTTLANDFHGGSGNDLFIGAYSDGGVGDGNTFKTGDILGGGGGVNTLIIDPNIAVGAGAAAATLTDGLWTHITEIEKVDVTTTAGALTITSGSFFERAFAELGITLTATTGAGAMNIDTTTFTGVAAIDAMTLLAGAQTITTGSGRTWVTATAFAGSQTITGANLVEVLATDEGAGAQTIISTGVGGVTIVAVGASGAQTITTGAGNDHIKVITSAGATNTITSGAGQDVIILSAAAGAGSHNTITGGRGADLINLGLQSSGTVDTLVYAPGDSLSTGFDKVTGMAATDFLSYTSATTALLADGSHSTGVSGLAATSSSGVLTFSGALETLGTEYDAALRILAAPHVAGSVDAFGYGGNTYVVEYNGSINPTVVELVGVAAHHLAIAGSTVSYA